MTAPSLVLLSADGADPRAARVGREIRDGVTALRPELDVHVCFVDHGSPSLPQLTNKLARRRVSEIVVVPLVLGDGGPVHSTLPQLLAAARVAHPGLALTAARPIGPDPALLGVVDRRLRESLRARRVRELDGLVLASAGRSHLRGNAVLARRARQWSSHHRLPCVTAFAHDGGPSAAEAIRSLRSQGRRHVAVGSLFLAHDRDYLRLAAGAWESGAVGVSAPLGGEPEIVSATLTRYVVAAMELVDLDLLVEDEPAPVRHLSVVGA